MDAEKSAILTYPSSIGDSQFLYPSHVGLEQISSINSTSGGTASSDITGIELLKFLNHFYIAQDATYPDLSFYNLRSRLNLLPERKRNYSLLNSEGERLFLITDNVYIRGSIAAHTFNYNVCELDGKGVFSVQRSAPEAGKSAKNKAEAEVTANDGKRLGRVVITNVPRRCKGSDYQCELLDESNQLVGYIAIGNGKGLDHPLLEARPSELHSPRMFGQIFTSLRQTIKPSQMTIEDYVLTFYEAVPVSVKALAIAATILMDFVLSNIKKEF